jgi:hypothetical protein
MLAMPQGGNKGVGRQASENPKGATMNNQTNPACRDAFIAAMEADGGDYDYHLTWYPLVSDGKGNSDDPMSWEWEDGTTRQVYQDGWCLAWQPPSDVDKLYNLLRRCLERFRLYEMDVDDEPPHHHRRFVEIVAAVLNGKPPRDVDPESVLGKLKAEKFQFIPLISHGPSPAILIELIETLQEQVELAKGNQ